MKTKGSDKVEKGAFGKQVNSFSFKWNDRKQLTKAKVFRKKEPVETINKKQDISKRITDVVAKPAEVNLPIKNDTFTNMHVKRKQRKDKVLKKQLVAEGKESDIPKPFLKDNRKEYSLFSEKAKNVYVNTTCGKAVSENVFANSGNKFDDLGIHRHLISNLAKINFTVLTNVQEKAIPVVLSGKNTLIRSQTGSGKTLAYAVPIIDALQGITPRLKRTDGVQAVIVVPTRELALQTQEFFQKINTFQWIVTGYLCGGENRRSEKERLRKGVNVLIGTPGRLLDHVMHTSTLNLSKVRCLVLDEADRLLDMGFRQDIISLVEEIDKAKANSDYDPLAMLKQTKSATVDEDNEDQLCDDIPTLRNVHSKDRQTILLSATLTKGVSELADFTMKDHVYVDALDETQSAQNESDDFVIPNTVNQEFIVSYVKHRLFTLAALIVAKSKQNSKLFVFMASGHMVDFHYELFTRCLQRMPINRGKSKSHNFKGEKVVIFDGEEDEEDAEEIVLDTEFFKLHGSMDQKARKEVFEKFRAAKKGVLICTDVAARGLDVPEADCIVQYTTPQTDEDYLHRVGRTGRAGKSGSAIIFLTHEEQEYIDHLKEHKVFLKEKDPKEFLHHLCDLMKEPNFEEAATALQRHCENTTSKDSALNRSACFAYSTWSRYYNSYPSKLRPIFDFKRINLGHYVTSFALRITPTEVAKVVRGQIANVEQPRLNKKLANHKTDQLNLHVQTKKKKTINSSTSEFSSGLEPMKKKKKKKDVT